MAAEYRHEHDKEHDEKGDHHEKAGHEFFLVG
jgi:hypothetical protein